MLKEFKKLIAAFPEKGMALHGTSYKNALSIKKTGLKEIEGGAYSVPLPSPKYQKEIKSPSKLFHRTIGSVVFATHYAGEKYQNMTNSKLTPKQLPAIVIFRDKQIQFMGYDQEKFQPRFTGSLKHKLYRSFGKAVGPLPANSVVKIVRITKKEQLEILRTITAPINQTAALQNLLIKKTLLAIKRLILKK
ncbi:hypothetical protein HY989_05930 [Candidatus Micrarchaeota archaeon]|nr:hypothetical protein [Candidatus Micrarchaeota archaeon]